MRTNLFLIIFFVFLILTAFAVFGDMETKVPTSCQDSDGDCDFNNIDDSDGTYEPVDLLNSPYAWVNATDLNNDIPTFHNIENATILVEWYSDVGSGAQNIWLGYYNGTDWLDCAGPLSETASKINTTCNVTNLTATQINNIMVRIRGEDGDGSPSAFAYVDYVELEVNHTSPLQWRNLSAYPDNFTRTGQTLNLTAEGFSGLGLGYAVLSTNESGEWVNYTDGTYGSPMSLGDVAETWTWSNFTWRNDSVSGFVGWRIHYNDSIGRENSTGIETFYVQFTRLPVACQDSDGDCAFSKINETDDDYESVDLTASPFGWVNSTDWDYDIPGGPKIKSAYMRVEWHTDTGLGAENIRMGYWDGNGWVDCSGPFSENAADQTSSCDISSLTASQINDIKVRFTGEDPGAPPALGYVDRIYIEANFSSTTSVLEVELILPDPDSTTNIVQNQSFNVNATVYCRNDYCGYVNGTVRYNSSSPYPDIAMNTSEFDRPFHVVESSYPSSATLGCPTNPLEAGEFCNITWVANATADPGSGWEVGVLFNSTSSGVQDNHTDNATMSVTGCAVDFNLTWSSIDFGSINPDTNNNSAPGNAADEYNITLNPGCCFLDFYIRGIDWENQTYGSTIGIENMTWSNISSVVEDGFYAMTAQNAMLKNNIEQKTNVTSWYWLNAPPVYAGLYNGTIYIKGVEVGEAP